MCEFTNAVEHNLDGIHAVSPGVAAGCCPECEPDDIDEGSFSWSECDSCGSRLGGDRHVAHGFGLDDGALYHLSICTDCVVFHANGDIPEDWSV